MKYGYYYSKDELENRLNRIEGQIRGISNMVQMDKYCIDILTQISAAQAALDKVGLELLRTHARHCLSSQNINNVEDTKDKADELVGAISRMLSR